MKPILHIFIFYVLLFGQSNYKELTAKAWKSYQDKNYVESAETYLKAFNSLKNMKEIPLSLVNDRYNAACSWALAGRVENSFEQLSIISKNGKYTNLNHIKKDSDLKVLHSDSRWKSLLKEIEKNYEKIKPLSKNELRKVFEKYREAQKKVFRKGSTVADVNRLYRFYTDDFQYNHPGYGGIYSRELLYNNTVRYVKNDGYDDSPKRQLLNIIIGLNGIAIEEQYEGDDKTRMTLLKFRKDKIYYIHEYW